MNINSMMLTDFYKFGHVEQYPKGTAQVWSNWTPRSSRIVGVHKVVNFGLSYFIQEILIEHFNTNFFNIPLPDILRTYKEVCLNCLGIADPKTNHIENLWKAGYLPIKIYSLPEGMEVPLQVPMLVITNTEDHAFWLPNFIESILSNYLWKPMYAATTANVYKRILTKAAIKSGETDLNFVEYQGHDFSFRGLSGLSDAVQVGMGHLASFRGTDTVPALFAAKKYYKADLSCGGSVPATEHSVMCAGGQESEFKTFERLLDTYPTGIISIVSDTWDLWKVLTEYIPRLKEKILARDGKLVIRPDSGDPVKICCGDPEKNTKNHIYNTERHPAFYGAVKLLGMALGVDSTPGGKLIRKGGIIYGDSITPERCQNIVDKLIDMGYSTYNMVFGIGSFTYEYATRDTYGFAMKATAIRMLDSNTVIPIFKKPVTDDGGKFSHRGIVSVFFNKKLKDYAVVQESTPEMLDECSFIKVFENSKLLYSPSLDKIRETLRENLID